MLGCWSLAATLISRRNRSAPIETASSGRRTLMATLRSCRMSSRGIRWPCHLRRSGARRHSALRARYATGRAHRPRDCLRDGGGKNYSQKYDAGVRETRSLSVQSTPHNWDVAVSTIVELTTPSPLPEAGPRLEARNHLGHYAQKQQVAGGCRPPAAYGSPVGPRGLVAEPG